MAKIAKEYLEHQRRRWMRPDAHLYIRHDAWRFMRPGSPIYVGRDVVKYFWPEADTSETARRDDSSIDPAPLSDDELASQRLALARLRVDWELLKFELRGRKAGFNPDQPRDDHGRWTSGSGGQSNGNRQTIHDAIGQETWETIVDDFAPDGSLIRETIVNRDGSAIRSEFAAGDANWDERHTVLLADGSHTTFQNSGDTQTILDGSGQRLSETVWTSNGPEPQAIVQPAFYDPRRLATQKAIEAGATLYTWLSSRNGPDRKAVFAFHADAFVPGATIDAPAIHVGQLTREDVDDACPRHAEVQSITDQAVNSTDRGAYESNAAYGTAVHKKIEVEINGPTTVPRSPPRDPNFRAEASLLKSEVAGYGILGSRRVDVLENPGKGTVCVYDIKTGVRGLSFARARELASTVLTIYPGTQRIIVTEVRQNR
jgi:hypothetical protein